MKNVEDIYPLSPMQGMMLLHSLSRPEHDVLFNQFCYEITGPIDVDQFRGAWQEISHRHPAMRTCFVWKTLNEPLQVVREELSLAFEYVDLRDRTARDQEQAIQRALANDQQAKFDISKAPLTRYTLLHCESDRAVFIWSSHHLIVDRWCMSTIFDEFFAFYEGRSQSLERPYRFRDYIEWIRRQDVASAHQYWSKTLSGFARASKLTELSDAEAHGDVSSGTLEVTEETTAALKSLASRNQLSLGTVFQGAWALVLNHFADSQDVVFGVSASGRPPALTGVESIVGSCVNNLPVRVRMPGARVLREYFAEMQASQQARTPYDYLALSTIRDYASVPASEPLFDTLLVWLASDLGRQSGAISFRGLKGSFQTAYPLTVNISESDKGMTITVNCDGRYRALVAIDKILGRLSKILEAIAAQGLDARLNELPEFKGNICIRSDAHVAAQKRVALNAISSEVTQAKGRESSDVGILEDLVLLQWRGVLGEDAIDLNADFFDLGGDSLMAAALHNRIEAATRQSIPLITLFENPTVASMAALLASQDWPLKTELVIPVRANGTKAPLFCIASPEVNTLGYAMLTRHLAKDVPVFVVQAPPEGDDVRALSVAELPAMAAMYCDAVKALQPQGPYYLLGMCSGASLAVEMGKQFKSEGDDVAFVAVINTWAFYTVSWFYYLEKIRLRMRWYLTRLRELSKFSFNEQLATLRRILSRRARNINQAVTQAAVGRTNPNSGATENNVVGWARRAPQRVKYPGIVTVFRMKLNPQRFWRIRDFGLGWGGESQAVEVVVLNGTDHHTLLTEPQVGDVGRKVQDALNRHHQQERHQHA